MAWKVEFHRKAEEELEAMPHSIRAKFKELFEDIELNGFSDLSRNRTKNIEDGIMEFRVTSQDGTARSLYATATGRELDILLAFVKKTEKTPRRYIELAKKRRSEIENERNDTAKRSRG